MTKGMKRGTYEERKCENVHDWLGNEKDFIWAKAPDGNDRSVGCIKKT